MTKAIKVLQVLHLNLCQLLSISSLFGSNYFITFIDDFNKNSWVLFLKKKFETMDKFKLFKATMENKIGKTIKTFKNDIGGEFVSQSFI
jgi:hypothetical protein